MRALLEVLEIFLITTFVSGTTLNLLLLYLIRNFSTKELGTYKNLLEIFAVYDIYLVAVYHASNPKAVPSESAYAYVSDREYGGFMLTCFNSSCYAVPFVLLNIHLLYRYWAIVSPHKIALFSQAKFIGLLIIATILLQITWFLSCIILGRPFDVDEIRHFQSIFQAEYEREINEGWMIMAFWRNGELCVRPFLLLVVSDTVELVTFSLAAALASLTFQEIRKARHISPRIRAFQMQVLIAAIAQTLTPAIFVYLQYFLSVTLPFFSIYSQSFPAISMLLISVFPCVDAVVIIGLMKPYRAGLLRMLGWKDDKKTMVIAAPFSTSVGNGQ